MLLERVGSLVESEGRLLPVRFGTRSHERTLVPVALASSTPLALIKRCLAHFDLSDRFASVHSAEFEPYGNHTLACLSAAASLGIEPTRCLVFRRLRRGCHRRASGEHECRRRATPETGRRRILLADLVLDTLMRCRGLARRTVA